MPYEEHPLLTNPKGKNLKIWRYMDFTKLVSLLQKEKLFFPSTRTLKKIDPWEGTYLKKSLEYRLAEDCKFMQMKGEKPTYEKIKDMSEKWNNCYENFINLNCISCWHYNSIESAAMWRLYLKSNEGIAIQTDVKSIKRAFANSDSKVYFSKIWYKDYENDIFYSKDVLKSVGYRNANLLIPFICKRKNYEHEKEYRAIVTVENNNKEQINFAKENGGIFVPVDLKLLIKKIILAPGSPPWFKELVEGTLKTYNFDVEVVPSVVDDEPYKFDLEPYKNV
ncbi:MAG: DUF2971 domain-containing protein [Ignavibacteria bacterium]|jgi:hypothetical protein